MPQFLIVLVLIFAVLYVLMIRPQRQRQSKHQSMLDQLGVGDDVLTTGGIYGTVTQVESEGEDLVVEIADGVIVHMTRRGIAAVLPPEEEEDETDEDDDEEPDHEADETPSAELEEAAVTGGEESVTTASERDSSPGDRG